MHAGLQAEVAHATVLLQMQSFHYVSALALWPATICSAANPIMQLIAVSIWHNSTVIDSQCCFVSVRYCG